MNMYHNKPPTHEFDHHSDEIDLLELCATLWRGKWVIAATMTLCLLPVVLWLKWQAPIYKIEILLNSTSAYDIQSLQPSTLPNGQRYQVTPLEREAFYKNFLVQAGALNTQKLFWEHWSQQALTSDPSQGNTENDIQFKNFSNNLTLTLPNAKNHNTTLSQLSLETPQPTKDMELLNAYVDFVNNRVVSQFVSQLEKGYASNLQQLALDYNALQQHEQQKLEDELVQLKEALNTARSLNITETPYEQLSGVELKVVDNRQYMLGTHVLSEEIKTIEARSEKPLSAFVPQLRDMEYWQKIMENDLQRLSQVKDDVQAFELASLPATSMSPIKPKKLLIFLAALLISGMIGTLIVFIIQGVRSYQAREGNALPSS